MASNIEQFGYAIYNDQLIFFEGIWGDEPNVSYHYSYSLSLKNPISDSLWKITPINDTVTNYSSLYPITASQQTQAQIGNSVYTVSPYGDWSNYLLIFDVNTHNYHDPNTYNSTIPNAQYGYKHSCVTSYGAQFIYSIGGIRYNEKGDKEYLKSTLVYDTYNDVWWYLNANMTNPRANFGCSFEKSGENLYVFGGSFGNVSDKTIETWNVEDNRWGTLEPFAYLPYGFDYGNCILYPYPLEDNPLGNIYCVGGAIEDGRYHNIPYVQIFNPKDLSFKVINLTIARSNFGIGLYGGCMLVFGGALNGEVLVDTASIEGLNCNFTYI